MMNMITVFMFDKDLEINKYTVFYNIWCNSIIHGQEECAKVFLKVLDDKKHKIKCKDYGDLYIITNEVLDKIEIDKYCVTESTIKNLRKILDAGKVLYAEIK